MCRESCTYSRQLDNFNFDFKFVTPMTHIHQASDFGQFTFIYCRVLDFTFYYLLVGKTASLLAIKYHVTLSTIYLLLLLIWSCSHASKTSLRTKATSCNLYHVCLRSLTVSQSAWVFVRQVLASHLHQSEIQFDLLAATLQVHLPVKPIN